MQALRHQIAKAEACWNIMLKFKYVYLQGLPRSGKTLTSLLTAEKSKRIQNVLVLTPKAAISGWYKFIDDKELRESGTLTKNYFVTNYEQVGSIVLRHESKSGKPLKRPIKELKLKINPEDYDLVIIDESHRLGKLGAPTNRYKVIAELCKHMPHIHLSGSAIVESPNSIYYQMHISQYTPFQGLNTFYDYFRVFGMPYTKWIGPREVNQYDKANSKLMPHINEFTVYMTQEDAGIGKEVQATDTIHYVPLDESTRLLYNQLQKDEMATLPDGTLLICDTTMKLRTSLHTIEGGTVKVGNEYHYVGNLEKINYIKEHFGDHKGLGIMSNFIGERQLIEEHFEHAKVYSSTADAEGVDLSHLNDFVVYSSGYQGSKFIQRRERIVNINQSSTTVVHHLLCKGAISEQVYYACSKKHNFNNETYKKKNI